VIPFRLRVRPRLLLLRTPSDHRRCPIAALWEKFVFRFLHKHRPVAVSRARRHYFYRQVPLVPSMGVGGDLAIREPRPRRSIPCAHQQSFPNCRAWVSPLGDARLQARRVRSESGSTSSPSDRRCKRGSPAGRLLMRGRRWSSTKECPERAESCLLIKPPLEPVPFANGHD